MYVTEDTTRSDLYVAALLPPRSAPVRQASASRHRGPREPVGARAVVRFARKVIDEAGGEHVAIDWHGHRDRDMGTINSVAALEAGASRVHGTILGIGERVGNTPMDLLMVNLVLMGWIERDLTQLDKLVHAVSEATGEPIPDNYPVFGRDAFRTATGVHAAAVVKAFHKKDPELMDGVYSGVPARLWAAPNKSKVGPSPASQSGVLAGASRDRRRQEIVDVSSAVPKRRRQCSPSRRSSPRSKTPARLRHPAGSERQPASSRFSSLFSVVFMFGRLKPAPTYWRPVASGFSRKKRASTYTVLGRLKPAPTYAVVGAGFSRPEEQRTEP